LAVCFFIHGEAIICILSPTSAATAISIRCNFYDLLYAFFCTQTKNTSSALQTFFRLHIQHVLVHVKLLYIFALV
jgi:hypothetical protein